MGDFQNQQVGAEQDDLQNRDAQSVAAEYPATAEVRSRIASGAPNASAIAKILHEHPKARNEIMALIHKALGNGFAQQVAAENERIFRAEADDGPGIKEGKGAAVGSKNDPMSDFRDVNKTNRAMQPAVDGAELRANATDNAPLNTPLSGASTAAPDATSAAPAAGGMTKTQLELQEIQAYEAEMKTPGKSDASTPAAPTSKSALDADTMNDVASIDKGPNHGLSKAQTAANMMEVDDFDRSPLVKGKANAAAPQVEEPQQASKVLKDETVIASSAEVKQPEIVRATEVLKDPNQGEEPQKASDVVKDDDAENEGSGGGAKADAGPVKITASVLRVRSSPKISKGNIVGRLTKDTVVEAIGHSGEWVEIKYKGQTAFVHSSFVVGAQETAIAKASDQVAPATAT